MKNYTYEESMELTKQALDKLDIKRFLRQGREVFDIVSDIEHYLIIESHEDLEEFWDYLDLHEDFSVLFRHAVAAQTEFLLVDRFFE